MSTVILMWLGCVFLEKSSETGVDSDATISFSTEEAITLHPDDKTCEYFYPQNIEFIFHNTLFKWEIDHPEPPYEIRGFTIRLYSLEQGFGVSGEFDHNCDTRTPVTVFAFVGDDSAEITEYGINLNTLADQENYTSAPYDFPDLPNGVSTQASGELGVRVWDESEAWSDRTELVTVMLDEPFLVEEDAPLWIGATIYDDSQVNCACMSACMSSVEGVETFIFESGEWGDGNPDSFQDIGIIVGY
jgi:hypothetical protein